MASLDAGRGPDDVLIIFFIDRGHHPRMLLLLYFYFVVCVQRSSITLFGAPFPSPDLKSAGLGSLGPCQGVRVESCTKQY